MRKTKFIVSCLAALTLLGVTAPCTANANEQDSIAVEEVSAAAINPGGDSVEPQSEIIQWVYQEYPDGSLYKRLYNYSRGMWVGNWIKIRDAYK